MQLLDNIKILDESDEEHTIELWQGDLTDLPLLESVDILVISAFPDDYTPTPNSLIGALDKKGISVHQLSLDKLEDKRSSCYCWMSSPLKSISSGMGFRQILCYEPPHNIHPAEAVGNVFRCLASYAGYDKTSTNLAMPLLASGDAAVPIVDMLEPLIDAAVNWMKNGLLIKNLKIVELSPMKAMEIKGAFSVLKKHYQQSSVLPHIKPYYDIFLSYCQLNANEADFVYKELLRQKGDLNVFMDIMELEPGMAWQQKIFDSLINCRKIMTLYSPQYLSSPACQEEYNISQLLHLKTKAMLFPVYLYDADPLPHYMMFWQYIDCRQGNRIKLRNACKKIVTDLGYQ